MIVKVCGIKTEENINDISKLPIDMIGLNFYSPSVRYVNAAVVPQWYDTLPDEVSRVGVFVNMELDDLLDLADEYRLDYAQLHGDESIAYTREVAKQLPIIKVVRVADKLDMEDIKKYDFAEYILFDKDSNYYGGSGHQFDWSLLSAYDMETPFLLAGGIGPVDINKLKTFSHAQFAGIDINSRFESEPGVKDAESIGLFLEGLKP